MANPTYSILVPVYNGEALLPRCLDSILADTGGAPAWEIVCVDDASADATPARLGEYAARDPRIRVVRHETNRGLGEARNTALAHALGSWVAWVDADDAVLPGWAAAIRRETRCDEVDAFCFGARMWRGERFWEMRYAPDPQTVPAAEFLTNVIRDVGSSTWLWNKVFRKSLFEGLRFSGRCQEDFHLTPAIFSRARKVRAVPDALYDYFRPAGSLSRHGDQTGSSEGLLRCLKGWAAAPGPLPADFDSAWKEGCALRAADYLRNAGRQAELSRFLRRNVFRVIADPRQSWRTRAKCLLACAGL